MRCGEVRARVRVSIWDSVRVIIRVIIRVRVRVRFEVNNIAPVYLLPTSYALWNAGSRQPPYRRVRVRVRVRARARARARAGFRTVTSVRIRIKNTIRTLVLRAMTRAMITTPVRNATSRQR